MGSGEPCDAAARTIKLEGSELALRESVSPRVTRGCPPPSTPDRQGAADRRKPYDGVPSRFPVVDSLVVGLTNRVGVIFLADTGMSSRDSLAANELTEKTSDRGRMIIAVPSRVDAVFERGRCTIRRWDGDLFLGPRNPAR